MVESFLIDRRSQSLSPDTIELYAKKLQYFLNGQKTANFVMGHVGYFPTIPEVAVSIGIFSTGIMAFGLLAKYFPVFEQKVTKPTQQIENVK